MPERVKIQITGIVQGVGFRPFIYRLARRLRLTGYVRNTTGGVEIEVEGSRVMIRRFIDGIPRLRPQAARIDGIYIKSEAFKNEKSFRIDKSRFTEGITHLSPDIAVCISCLKEFESEKDRRYKYPFINCTNCGPRYSIISNTPYDRKRTSMRDFTMCHECSKEFEEITDRRFHAQPDCCSVCGPSFELFGIDGKKVPGSEPIEKTVELLKQGRIVAIKGVGGFHFACDATNKQAVEKLRKLKNRPTKPFAVMTCKKKVSRIAYANVKELKLLASPAAPIMLLKRKKSMICREVAPASPYLGIMLPYVPVHFMLLEKIPFLIMTSANVKDEPLVINDKQVKEKLKHIVAYYLTHNRDILNRCDDSVGYYLKNYGFSILRRSRGYVPVPVELPFRVKPSLAVGPYLKNTFTLAHKNEAFVSPHIGDLDNLETLSFYNEMLDKYKRWFRIYPKKIIHDLHPDYLSTKVAQRTKGERVGVQHHVAHIAACLGENKIFEDAIGIAFDGTGYGDDGKIWGGEFFLGSMRKLKRIAHLEYMPLPGGEESIKKPYRIAIAYLHRKGLVYPKKLQAIQRHQKAIEEMVEQNYNIVWTSSMGRLFDCVSAMLGITGKITYEAEAAINLEYVAADGEKGYYPYKLITENEKLVINIGPLLAGISEDIGRCHRTSVVAARFHNTVVRFSLDIARRLRKLYGVNNVCMSGGVFQNRLLLSMMLRQLRKEGYRVLTHRQLPTNDGCISYGQMIYGNLISQK